jgi:hypothetical protein
MELPPVPRAREDGGAKARIFGGTEIAKMATMNVAAIALVDRRLNVMVGTLALGWECSANK